MNTNILFEQIKNELKVMTFTELRVLAHKDFNINSNLLTKEELINEIALVEVQNYLK